ncbi:MAG: 50S ribosomal protein L10 [Lachnospiraceae bacterium]|nr:50S ribosomal protein L10 [Lachnospiraceae bacterium]MDE6941332.1 50S ribosomal protein L10 [Lachnospiraceae bacterium]
MAKIELKQPIVEEIASTVKDAATVVIVSYSGITVAQDTQLRRQLREAGVTYKVYKNTLMTRAFKGTEFEGLTESLKGTNAIAVCKDDATAPARILSKFAKDCPAIQLKAGVVEGIVYDEKGMAEIAKIPSRDELISKFLGSIQSPITNFARVLNQIAEKGGADACEPAPKETAEDGETVTAEAAAEAPAAE